MNDFTKEELILILGFLRGAYSVTHDGTELKAEKIISMIDNYCEHVTNNPNGAIIICEGDINNPNKCSKCGEFY